MKGGFDSKMESDYADHLRLFIRSHIIKEWYRCVKPDDTLCLTSIDGKCKIKYTPDFKVSVPNSNGMIFIEVKGRNFNGREDRAGITNFKHFAIQHPQHRFVMVTKEKGSWKTMHDINPEVCPLENDMWRKK